jgi:two-component system, NtrC family, sensor kinase
MTKKIHAVFICIFFVTCFIPVDLKSQVIYDDPTKNLEVENQLYFIEDKNQLLTIEDVATSNSFQLITKKVQNFGITSSAIWLKLSIQNKSDIPNLILQVNQPIIDEIDFYSYNDKLKHYHAIKMGEYQVFSLRKYLTPQYLFDLEIPKDSVKIYFIKIRCKENMQIPISVGTSISTLNSTIISNLASGIYVGIMLVMILYNLFIYITIKDKSYILYSLYIIFILLTQTSLQGYTFQFLWPNFPWLALQSPFLFPALVGMVALEFFKQFLQLKSRFKKAYILSFVFIIPYCISICLGFFGFYKVSFMMVEATAGAVSVFMLAIAYLIYKKGYSEARFFLVGWLVFLLGVCIYVLKDFEVLSYNNFTRYTMHFGSAVEVLLLSFALAERINILKKEKEDSQAEALLISQQNQKLITEQNIVLEQKVSERTLALEGANKELNVTLNYLKDTQSQLVEAEKMASLGQLTAGIAHEINNPINFVSANVRPLKMDIQDILDLVEKYETITPNGLIEAKLKEIDAFKKHIDLDYVKSEIQNLLTGIEDGAKRTAEIVSGLKNFSRLDESDIKIADVNEGIESTLVILRSSIPNNVHVITNLDNVPMIECFPGKLNQVFMNVLSNAIYAMKQNAIIDKHTLKISTFTSGENVCVSISDTGIGMTPEVKAKVFEPFFTTKDVGEGTGLGMSIVFKIIESHQAKLDIETEHGKGTTILITLNKKINSIINLN